MQLIGAVISTTYDPVAQQQVPRIESLWESFEDAQQAARILDTYFDHEAESSGWGVMRSALPQLLHVQRPDDLKFRRPLTEAEIAAAHWSERN